MRAISSFLLVLRTLRYVKPIQILNRLCRKFPCGQVAHTALPVRDFGRLTLFPRVGDVWDGKDSFTFLNETHRIQTAGDWNSPELQKLWLYNLHYFDCLRQMTSCSTCELIDRWIDENPVGTGNGWEPYPISLRVVNWIKFAHTDSGEYVRGEKFRASLAIQVRWLEKRLEYHLLANHLLANAKALVFAGMYFDGPESERWLKKGMDIYRRELPEQTCSDGVNFERSAMYHSIILEDVMDCYNITRDDLFMCCAEKMLVGLKMLTGPDGKIVKFNDAADGIALCPDVLFAYAEELGIKQKAVSVQCQSQPLTSTFSSGFTRMEKGAYCVIAKCGDIGPSYQPGHAHADTFTFEMWKDGRKIVGDTGCSTYVSGPIRSYERSTAAHNTVVIDGKNSSEVWAAHRVGRRFDKRTHRRSFELAEEGLNGVDEIFGHGVHDLEVRFHLPPGVGEDDVNIVCAGERRVESCEFAVGWNKRESGRCIVYHILAQCPTTITWTVS